MELRADLRGWRPVPDLYGGTTVFKAPDLALTGTWIGVLNRHTLTVTPILHLVGDNADACATAAAILVCSTEAGALRAWRLP